MFVCIFKCTHIHTVYNLVVVVVVFLKGSTAPLLGFFVSVPDAHRVLYDFDQAGRAALQSRVELYRDV